MSRTSSRLRPLTQTSFLALSSPAVQDPPEVDSDILGVSKTAFESSVETPSSGRQMVEIVADDAPLIPRELLDDDAGQGSGGAVGEETGGKSEEEMAVSPKRGPCLERCDESCDGNGKYRKQGPLDARADSPAFVAWRGGVVFRSRLRAKERHGVSPLSRWRFRTQVFQFAALTNALMWTQRIMVLVRMVLYVSRRLASHHGALRSASTRHGPALINQGGRRR